jgi:3-(3-hydroxy-phenyl)propionate hydroxylase
MKNQEVIIVGAGTVGLIAENAAGVNRYRCSWLVGADRSYSVVRRELGLALAGMTWPERLVATDLRFDFAALGYKPVGYLLSPDMGSVVTQIDKTGLWRFTHAESRMLDGESVMERVRAALDRILPAGAAPVVERASPYRIHQRSAERLRVGRVVLVGDAAHVTKPILTFGITSGLFDAYALIEALSAVVNNDVSDEILSWYSHVRYRDFWEYTSPLSAEVKELLFSAHEPGWLEARLARLRATARDPVALGAYFPDESRCAMPSLLADAERCVVKLDRFGQSALYWAGGTIRGAASNGGPISAD